MRNANWIKQTRREYIRDKKQVLRAIREKYKVLRRGSILHEIYGTTEYFTAVRGLEAAINEVGEILKNIKC